MDAKKRRLSSVSAEEPAVAGTSSLSSNCTSFGCQALPRSDFPPKSKLKQDSLAYLIDGCDDKEFREMLRFKRPTVELLIWKYTAYEAETGLKPKLSPRPAILMFLYYVTQDAQYTYIFLAHDFRISRKLAVMTMRQVTAWLISVTHQVLKWPNEEEIEALRDKLGIPGAIGILESRTILIKKPKFPVKCYRDCKGDTGVILQAVIAADQTFLNIYCGEPGLIRKDCVLKRSELYDSALTHQGSLFPNGTFLLGCSAYKATDWLKTPLEGENLTADQQNLNETIEFALHHSEPVFKCFLARFPRLLNLTREKYLLAATNLICSACVLHNICTINEDFWYRNDRDSQSEGDTVAKD